MTLEVHALHEAPPQPWRNGGGSTRELLAWPDAAGWQCRISVAEIAQDGPFSPYPGVQRWFAVVAGAGVALRFGARVLALRPGDAPHAFDGADAPGCTLLQGPTLDLNLMVRSDAGRGGLQPVAAGAPWQDTAPLRALYAHGAGRLRAGDATLTLDGPALAFDTAAAPHTAWHFEPANGATLAWWLWFEPRTDRTAPIAP